MAHPIQSDIKNRLLAALTPTAFSVLQLHLEPATLNTGDLLNVPNEPTRFVYFLDTGLGSILLGPERATGVEVAMTGREGFIGTSVVLGSERSPHSSLVQLPGKGWRIASGSLTRAMEASPELSRLLLRFVHVFLTQVSSTAHSNADYTVEERLARWLLMCHDRVDGDQIAITHESMALMLCVRRPGVTVATHGLEGEGMIRAKRGLITVRDREKLKAKANGSYGLAEAEYERLFGPGVARSDTKVIPFPADSAGAAAPSAGLRYSQGAVG